MSELSALLERFRRGPELLALVMTGVYGEEEDFAIAPGKWSIRQIIAHLADCELVGAYRFRLILAEDNPAILRFDEKAWAANLDYTRRKPKQSLETFRRLRTENYDLLHGVPESAFARTGNHNVDGVVTLEAMVRDFAEHLESHARAMQEIRDAYKVAKGKK